MYGAPSIRELCDNWYCLMDGSLAQLVGSADQVDFPAAPLGDIYIPFVFPSPLHCWRDYAIQYLRVLHCNPIGNIELNSLIETACLHRVKLAGAINHCIQSRQSVKLPSIVPIRRKKMFSLLFFYPTRFNCQGICSFLLMADLFIKLLHCCKSWSRLKDCITPWLC